LLLMLGLALQRSTPVHLAVALLAVTLLLRQQDRLMLAPLYGGALLLVEELAIRSGELAGVDRLGPGVIGARLGAALAVSALGSCAAAAVAAAVTAAPGRSLLLTAAGVVAAVLMFGAITHVVRQRYR
jgi:hypothetical protein